MKTVWTYLLILIPVLPALTQVEFTAKVDSTYMVMGDQQQYTLTLKSANGTLAPDFHIEALDTCAFLDIIGQTPWVKTQENNTIIQEKKIKFSIFEEGTFILPPMYAVIGLDSIYTYQIPIRVQGVEPDSTGLLPIKGIVREPAKWTDYLSWIISIIVLLIGYGIYRYLQYKKKSRALEIIKVPEKIILPHELALLKLRELQKSELWNKGEVKEYHVQLTYILREYLEHRYDIPALESTSIEIIRDLKVHHLTAEQINTVNEILNIADWVKFAKGMPEREANSQAILRAISLVQDTKPTEQPISDESKKQS